jgi:hypothetical protein
VAIALERAVKARVNPQVSRAVQRFEQLTATR